MLKSITSFTMFSVLAVSTWAADSLAVKTAFYPSRNEFKIEVKANDSSTGAQEAIVISVLDANGKNMDMSGASQGPLAVFKLPLNKLPPGHYKIIAKQGAAVSNVDFERPDESLWCGNSIGKLTNVPPPPWSNLELVTGDNTASIKCWGREINYDKAIFPTSIQALGKPMLAAPISLEAIINGKAFYPESPKLKAQSADALAAQLNGSAMLSDALKIEVNSKIEFDGLIVMTIRLIPLHPVKVDLLKMSIPLPGELVKYKFLPVYSRKDVGAFDKSPNMTWSYPFINYIWIGDEDRGLTWFSESSEGWVIPAGINPINVKRTAGDTIWSLDLIGAATVLQKPLVYTLGLQPTPVKPMPENQFAWGIGRNFQLYWTMPSHEKYFGYPEVLKPGVYDKENDDANKQGLAVVRYGLLTALSAASPEWKYYGNDWNSSDIVDNSSSDVIAFGNASVNMTCPAEEKFRDFIIWKMQKWVNENKFDGVYHDLSGVHTCDSKVHGCNGRMPILAWRELYKRAYVMLKKERQPSFQMQHVSWGLCSPILGFCDAYMNGEQYVGQNISSYLDRVPDDIWRTEFTGRQYGVVPLFIPALVNVRDAAPTQQLLGLLLLNGAPGFWPNSGYLNGQEIGKVFNALEKFGLKGSDITFQPYWGDSSILEKVLEPIRVSAYVKNNAVMLVVFNTATTPQSRRVDLKLKGHFEASDLLQQSARIEQNGNQISLDVPAGNYRLIQLKKRQ